MSREWKKLGEKYVMRSIWLSVRKDAYKTPGGEVIDNFYVVERPDFVVIVPLTIEKKFVLVKQYRHGLEREILNFPMGFIDEGDEPARTAVRELQEETGFSGGKFKFVGNFFLAPPLMKTKAHVFFADGVEDSDKSQNGELEEINKVVFADQSKVENFIETGKLSDLVSLCSYLLVKLRGFTAAASLRTELRGAKPCTESHSSTGLRPRLSGARIRIKRERPLNFQ